MDTAKKLSQQELRRLMREKANEKKSLRIDSPLARYDDNGNIWCLICNIQIDSELIWSTHLIGKSHKKKVEELKQKQKNPIETIKSSSNVLKRSAPVETGNTTVPAKISKIESKTELRLLEKKSVEQPPPPESNEEGLPRDFFDDGIKIETKVPENSNATDNGGGGGLPKDFFDQPSTMVMKQQKNRTNFIVSKIESKEIDSQMELFRKQIDQLARDAEMEEEKISDPITELDEQIEHWAKVNELEKKIEQIRTENHPDQNQDDDDDDDDPDIDLNDINLWRKKDVFH